ncbi:hypothetical protein K438DRAFT_1749291 [Mycena galopus ATCC 62051]|nr:hypothetical protein K438DRAFT_1749291 [Mycena galopus ATCC 62051]
MSSQDQILLWPYKAFRSLVIQIKKFPTSSVSVNLILHFLMNHKLQNLLATGFGPATAAHGALEACKKLVIPLIHRVRCASIRDAAVAFSLPTESYWLNEGSADGCRRDLGQTSKEKWVTSELMVKAEKYIQRPSTEKGCQGGKRRYGSGHDFQSSEAPKPGERTGTLQAQLTKRCKARETTHK